MNNKVQNYANFVEKKLIDHHLEYIIERGDPSKEDLRMGNCGYYVLIVTQEATGVLSDSTETGEMFYAVAFHQVDDFLKEVAPEVDLDAVESFVILRDIKSFIKVLTNKETIDIFVCILKEQLRSDLNL